MNEDDKITLEINKLHNRIPLWKNNPNQINSTILRLFFELADKDNGYVEIKELKKAFLFETNLKKDFESNFTQMHIFGNKNHGKVFEVINDKVKLWEPIAKYAQKVFC
jgi:hypothetical protein